MPGVFQFEYQLPVLPSMLCAGGFGAGILVLAAGVDISGFDGLEESSGGLLLGGRLGKELDGSTGLVHVTVEFSGDLEPGLLGNVFVKLSKALLGFSKNGLLLGNNFVGHLVKGLFTGLSVDGVGRVEGGCLVSSVSSTLRVRGTISDQTENRESGRFTDGGVGSGRNEGSAQSSGTSGDGFTAGSFLRTKKGGKAKMST